MTPVGILIILFSKINKISSVIKLITKETQFMQILKSIHLSYIPSTVPQCLSMYIIRMILHNQIDSWRDFFLYILFFGLFSHQSQTHSAYEASHSKVQSVSQSGDVVAIAVAAVAFLSAYHKRWRLLSISGCICILFWIGSFWRQTDWLTDWLVRQLNLIRRTYIQVCDGIYDG